MSQNLLPDVKTAYANLTGGIRNQVFFSKLESAGYPITTEKQAEYLLDLATKLRPLHQQVKAAEDPYASALAALDNALAATGQDGHAKQARAAEKNQQIKEAAALFSRDATIYNSVLALKAHEAGVAQTQFDEMMKQRNA